MFTSEDGPPPLPQEPPRTLPENILPFERLLSEVSAALILAPSASIEPHLQEGLRRLTEFFGADRSALCEHSASGQEIFERASYTCSGIPANPAGVPLGLSFPWWAERMLRGELVRVSAPADLPPEAIRERAYAEREGLQAFLSVPISIRGEHRHHLVLASFRQACAWSDDLVARLRLLGEMFAGAFERMRIERALLESEQRYREVFELTSDCIFLLDVSPDLRFVIVKLNPAEERTVGLSGVEGRFVDEVLPKEVADRLYANFRRCVEARHPISYEEAIELPIGVRYFHTTLIPVEDATGRVHRIVGIAHHITERIESEQATRFLADASRILAESLDYQTTLAHVARLAVPVLADWCVVDLLEDNKSRRIAGAHVDPSKEPLLQLLAERYPVEAVSPQPANRAMHTGQPILYANVIDEELREFTLDEGHAALIRALGCRSFMTIPLQARDRRIGAVSFVSVRPGRHYGLAELSRAQELSSRIALAIDNARLYREAQESIRMRDDFLSIAAHELRTPITSLNLVVQSLLGQRRPPTEENMLRVLRLVRRQTGRLTRLIEEVLTFSGIQGGHLKLNREEVDLVSVVWEVVELLEGELVRAGCVLELDAAAPVIGRWDRSRLDEVVTNLLTNAIKFGAGCPIMISIKATEGLARLLVADRGIGIAPDRLPHIFERFERAVSSSHYGGLGLGLYIVQEIVEAHGGSVRAESHLGAGSVFTVELPLSPM